MTLKESLQQIKEFWPIIAFLFVAIGGVTTVVANSYIDARIKANGETPASHLIEFREEVRENIADIKIEIGKLKEASGNNTKATDRVADKVDDVIRILLERQ